MPLPYEVHLALRYLRVHRGRTFLSLITLISVAGVTVGVAALVIALALMTGFQEDMRERILRGSAHLTVMNAASSIFGADEELLDRIRGVDGVVGAGPVLSSPAMLAAEDAGTQGYVELQGIDPGLHAQVIRPEEGGHPFDELEGRSETGRRAIVLGAELASSLGVLEGDRVRVVVPRISLTPFTPIPRSRVFEVVGFFRTDSHLLDSRRAYVNLGDARRLLGVADGVSWVEVRLEDLGRLGDMKTALSDALGGPWLVVDMIEENRELLKAFNTEKLILFLAIGLIVVVAALNIASTLILMVTDKIRDIGTLSALGARPAGIARVFMLQGVVIGTVGTALGVALGAGASVVMDHYQLLELNPDVYYLTHVPFVPTASDLVFAGGMALAVSFLATLYPAWKAATLDPVEAIRYE